MPRKRVRDDDDAGAASMELLRKASQASDAALGAAAEKRRARGGKVANHQGKDTAKSGGVSNAAGGVVEVSCLLLCASCVVRWHAFCQRQPADGMRLLIFR